MRVLLALLVTLCAATTEAFVAPGATTRSATALPMAPKYDKQSQLWSPTSPAEEPSSGYGMVNTLLLHGPVPFIQRAFKGADWEQGVLKLMASDKSSRDEAQGNMDAYLANPNDWAYNRLAEQNGGYKPDYVTLKTESLIKTLVWSVIVVFFASRTVVSLTTGEDFYNFL
jgi:hypothetical protein